MYRVYECLKCMDVLSLWMYGVYGYGVYECKEFMDVRSLWM